jgi:hypothetical protein
MADDYDEPDEPHEQDDGPTATLTIARPVATAAGSATVVDLDAVGWAEMIPAACAATTIADYEQLPFPPGIPDRARRVVAVWARHPVDTIGMLNWQGTYVVGEAGPPRPVTDSDPGDALAYELIGHCPHYPRHEHPDRPVDGIRTAWQAMVAGEAVELDDDVAAWWPGSVVVDRRDPRKCWVDLYAYNGKPISHTLLGGGQQIAETSPLVDPLVDFHGRPLQTVDYQNALSVTVEQVRVSKIPTGRPPGRPPSTASAIAAFTPRERLTAACLLVEQYGAPQASTARSLNVRTDTLNKALARRRGQRT